MYKYIYIYTYILYHEQVSQHDEVARTTSRLERKLQDAPELPPRNLI